MDVVVNNSQALLSICIDSIAPIVEAVLQQESEACDEIIIHFVEEPEICKIHKQFFNDDSATDCISIQVDEKDASPRFLGEIFISPKAALDYLDQKKEDAYQELTLYLVHGILHLIGYTDKENKEIQKMRLAEKRQMDYLKERNLLFKK